MLLKNLFPSKWRVKLALEYIVVGSTSANIVNISVYNALSIGSGPIAAVFLCVKRENI